jgi:hypothetical protein
MVVALVILLILSCFHTLSMGVHRNRHVLKNLFKLSYFIGELRFHHVFYMLQLCI